MASACTFQSVIPAHFEMCCYTFSHNYFTLECIGITLMNATRNKTNEGLTKCTNTTMMLVTKDNVLAHVDCESLTSKHRTVNLTLIVVAMLKSI